MVITLEEKNYSDRAVFKVKIVEKYPAGLNRKGMYEHYLADWVHGRFTSSCVDYKFTAYKKNNWLKRLFGNDYQNQRRIAIQRCDNLIRGYIKAQERPKVTNYDR